MTKATGTHLHFYQAEQLHTVLGATTRHTLFRNQDRLLAEQHGTAPGTAQLLSTDTQGSVLQAQGAQGTHPLSYTAFGHSADRDILSLLTGFNGEVRNTQTGWYLLGNGHRSYDPGIRRFHSPDSLSPFHEGGINCYGYCAGDPINRRDPTGQAFIPVFKNGPIANRPQPTTIGFSSGFLRNQAPIFGNNFKKYHRPYKPARRSMIDASAMGGVATPSSISSVSPQQLSQTAVAGFSGGTVSASSNLQAEGRGAYNYLPSTYQDSNLGPEDKILRGLALGHHRVKHPQHTSFVRQAGEYLANLYMSEPPNIEKEKISLLLDAQTGQKVWQKILTKGKNIHRTRQK